MTWEGGDAWLRHCATSRKVEGSTPDGVIDIILPTALWPYRRFSLWQKEYQEYLLRGKRGRCVGLTALPLSCADFLEHCFPTLTSLFISHGTPWGKHLFFKLIYFLIISYVRDKVVYCCWVSIYALINVVILFIYFFIYFFLFLHLAVPQGSAEPRLGITGLDIMGAPAVWNP
jgi:hypothetical protein